MNLRLGLLIWLKLLTSSLLLLTYYLFIQYSLLNEHRITEGEEAVFFLYCGVVGVQYVFSACQSTYQHNEGAFGQVEIGYEAVDRLEAVARVDEYGGLALLGMDNSALVRYTFQHSAGGGADGDESAFSVIDYLRGLLADGEPFGVHIMFCDIYY